MTNLRRSFVKYLRTTSGFTLPEVLVVIIIISILISIATPSYLGIIEKFRCINLGGDQHSTASCNEVKITIPSSNSTVPMTSTFQGTFRNISSNSTSWMYVYAPAEQRYYSDRIRELDEPSKKGSKSGTWSLYGVKIGGSLSSDNHQEYTIGILVTQGSSTKSLEEQEDNREELPPGIKNSEMRIVRQ